MGMLGRSAVVIITLAVFLLAQDFNVGNNTNVPTRLSTVSITGRTTAITTTNVIAAAPAGLYRLSGYMQTTTASMGVCVSDVTVAWTYNASAKSLAVVNNHDQAVDETYSQIPTTIVRSDAAGDITYAVSLDAGGGDCTSAAFAVFLVAERLQ